MVQAPLYSTVSYAGDGATDTFTVPFPYLKKEHVIVKVNDVPVQFTWASGSSIQITDPSVGSAPASGSLVRISRSTPRGSRMVEWAGGSTLTSADLNLNATQQFYIEQELWDSFLLSLGGVIGDFSTGTDGAPSSIDPTALLDNTIQSVLNSTLLSDLQARIGDIDTNASTIADQITRLDNVNTTLGSHETQINNLLTSVSDNSASISTETTNRVNGDNALSSRIDTATASINGNAAAIQTEQTARASGDSALSSLIALIGAKSSDGLSFIIDTSTAKVDATTSLADKFSALSSSIGSNQAAITSEAQTRSDQYNTLSQQINTLSASSSTFYVQATAPTNPNVGDVWYDSSNGNHPYRWDGTQWVDIQNAKFDTLAAEITTEQTARINGDNSLASTIALIGALSSDGSSFIFDASTAKVDATTSLADKLSQLTASIGSNSSAIQTEQTARADGDSANAQSITTLQTTVDGNTASIQTNAQSIDGLSAEYFVKTDVNGYVAGYGIHNNGTTSEFTILADKLAMVVPMTTWYSGWTPAVGKFARGTTQTAFIFKAIGVTGPTGSTEPTWPTTLNGKVVDGGVTWQAVSPNAQAPFVVGNVNGTETVGITGNLIVDGSIYGRSIKFGEITAQHINVGSLSALSADIGTVTAGTLKTSSGTGQRLEISSVGSWPLWYGSGSKSSANAKFYLDTAGNAFFSGVVAAANIQGSLMDQWTLRLDTGGGRRAPVQVYNSANYNGGRTSVTLSLGSIMSPAAGSGLNTTRVVDRKMDVFFDVNINGDGGNETMELQVKYDSGAWQTITSESADLNYRGSMTLKGRYTTSTSTAWSFCYFRVITLKGNTQNASASFVVNNFGTSANASGSSSFGTSGSAGSGYDTSTPPGYYRP